jgi:hypothetical protein
MVCSSMLLLDRRHPADAGAVGLHQDGDAADAGHVERGFQLSGTP